MLDPNEGGNEHNGQHAHNRGKPPDELLEGGQKPGFGLKWAYLPDASHKALLPPCADLSPFSLAR